MPTLTHPRLLPRKQRLLHPPRFAHARYVDIKKHWRKLAPLYKSSEAARIWRPCMEENIQWKAEDHGFDYRPQPDARAPKDYECCDWRCDHRGKRPAFWDYVCHAACHWLVDLNLYVAFHAYPSTPWRILTASTKRDNHSTVWNGDLAQPLLFDANFLALGVAAHEALRIAWNGRELRVGQYLKCYLHQMEALA